MLRQLRVLPNHLRTAKVLQYKARCRCYNNSVVNHVLQSNEGHIGLRGEPSSKKAKFKGTESFLNLFSVNSLSFKILFFQKADKKYVILAKRIGPSSRPLIFSHPLVIDTDTPESLCVTWKLKGAAILQFYPPKTRVGLMHGRNYMAEKKVGNCLR